MAASLSSMPSPGKVILVNVASLTSGAVLNAPAHKVWLRLTPTRRDGIPEAIKGRPMPASTGSRCKKRRGVPKHHRSRLWHFSTLLGECSR
jgi:hypothetical protein